MHMDLLYGEDAHSEDIQDPSDDEAFNLSTSDIKYHLHKDALREVFRGPRNLRADLEALSERLSKFHQLKIKEMETVVNALERSGFHSTSPLSLSHTSQFIKGLAQTGRHIQQLLVEQLGRQVGSGEARDASCDVDRLVEKALEFMVDVDKLHFDLIKVLGGALKTTRNMSA